jgi:hypothetical protein
MSNNQNFNDNRYKIKHEPQSIVDINKILTYLLILYSIDNQFIKLVKEPF